MGRMKEIYMELYYTMDGFIPSEYDVDSYLYHISQELKLKEEYEYIKKISEDTKSTGNEANLLKKKNP
jgi:hypothetical protein